MNRISRILRKNISPYHLLLIGIVSFLFTGCTSPKKASGYSSTQNDYNNRHLLLRDEGMSQLSYQDLANPDKNWYVPVPPGRDMQLVGNGRVLIGTANGYEEIEIATGKKLFELTSFPGTVAARRLRNGNTLLTGVNWQDKKGIVLVEVDLSGAIKYSITYTGFDYVRLVRETPTGNFLITSNNMVFEGNKSGEIVWKANITGAANPHSWQATRLANGQTLVSTGFSKNFQLFSKEGKLVDTISGPEEVKPNFYAGYQILANGNYIITNWQGHGATNGGKGTQLLEYTASGKLAWKWQQDAAKFSSIQAVILLDGLDLNLLQIEDKNGRLAPVKSIRPKN